MARTPKSPYRTRLTLTPYLLLSPAFLVLIFVVALPLVFSLYTSFTGYRLIRSRRDERHRLWRSLAVLAISRVR